MRSQREPSVHLGVNPVSQVDERARVEAALAAAGRGLALFALPPGERRPDPGWQLQAATSPFTDPARIATLLAAGANLGVGCRASDVLVLDLDRHPAHDLAPLGTVVVDVDARPGAGGAGGARDVVGTGDGEVDGVEVFAEACRAHGQPWPDTFTVATPHGGLHLYFRAGGRPITSTSGGRSGLGPGIDARGPGQRSGGYLVAPGSLIEAGSYTVLHDAPVMDLPAWLARTLATGAGLGTVLSTRRPRKGRRHGEQPSDQRRGRDGDPRAQVPGVRAPQRGRQQAPARDR